MGIFRNKKTKLQIWGQRAVASKAVYQEGDFPTIDIQITVAQDDNARKLELTEVTISLTMFEAAQLTQQLMYSVNTAQRFGGLPRMPINVPWGEGNNN